MHEIIRKKKYSGNYIPADGESLQFGPKMKSTPVTDKQASGNNHKPGATLNATLGYSKGSSIRRIIIKSDGFLLNSMGKQI